jgi:diguanylate cyclase (GGDEF)-like protein
MSENIKKEIKEINVDKKINDESKGKKTNYWKNLALRDNLTGIYNRNGWELLMKGITDEDLIFGIIDIDFFKKFNDQWGHDFGDEVLKTLAQYLDKQLIVGRYGGEEIVFMAPYDNKNPENVENYLNKIREDVKKLKLSKQNAKISVSIGYVEFDKNKDIDEIFDMADQALYCAKESGRDKIVEYGEEMEELGCGAHKKDENGELIKNEEECKNCKEE